jgi:GNAT superfamily N-acetyltransferase
VKLPIAIRAAVASDLAFICHSWRTTFHLGYGALGSDPEHYHREISKVFERLLPTATMRIAADPADADVIIGFAVFTNSELHYVFVRKDFRRNGVANALLADIPIRSFTFLTKRGEDALKPRARGWAFTPRWTI